MARLCVDVGRVTSKYDCVLGANLHPSLPVDRHIFAKRIRVWVSADGFISPLNFLNLVCFEPGPPAVWSFVANAGDGRTVEIQMQADMLADRNTTVFYFYRPTAAQATGKQLPVHADVRLTVRIDIEDRNFHSETKRNGGADYHFSTHVHVLAAEVAAPGRGQGVLSSPKVGFEFAPASDRRLRVFANSGQYHPQPEWSENIPHPIEQSRAQTGSGDAFSPGWFDLPLPKGASATLVVTADPHDPDEMEVTGSQEAASPGSEVQSTRTKSDAQHPGSDTFGQQLLCAAHAFVVRRDSGKSVIAGYPWFLDWGRDTLICARGLLVAGMVDEVKQMVVAFARFEKDGTLPNTIHGEDASNRDTSDAPLWFGIVCEELAAHIGSLGNTRPLPNRSLLDVLESIAHYYVHGTPNGIHMDPDSALIWSPRHFTWMDTNYPACTPREGYPVEIQALWIRLLRQLERIGDPAGRTKWKDLGDRASASFGQLFWREEDGYYADVLLAGPGQPAAQAVRDDALRSNCLFAVSLGLAQGERARRCAAAALRYLVVPGALRSLAPLPVSVPLSIHGNDGRLLNNPAEPYWGRYEGDEDTRRKPAYHNGTAWTWTFPVFCEALARAWDFSPEATAAARAYLGSVERLMTQGCLGQMPEIVDGDAPHTPRGCDAQAWGVTETLRVWKLLNPSGVNRQGGAKQADHQ
jgi:predicted glycogen debranching enzyme